MGQGEFCLPPTGAAAQVSFAGACCCGGLCVPVGVRQRCFDKFPVTH